MQNTQEIIKNYFIFIKTDINEYCLPVYFEWYKNPIPECKKYARLRKDVDKFLKYLNASYDKSFRNLNDYLPVEDMWLNCNSVETVMILDQTQLYKIKDINSFMVNTSIIVDSVMKTIKTTEKTKKQILKS